MIVALVILLEGAIGFGIVRHAEGIRPSQRFPLAMLLGLPVSSVLVIAIDLAGIRLAAGNLIWVFALAAILANIGALDRTRAALRLSRPRLPGFAPHRAVFPLAVACFAAISVWLCIDLPVIPRDATTGMDLVAKYAALEGKIDSSVFTGPELRGQLSNQPFYAPFTMLMQIVFRLAGMPFGQIWLSVLFLSFLIYIWSRLEDRLHPVVSGFLVLSFVTIPLMYSYTYLLATDYANALFFGLGAIFLHDFSREGRPSRLVLSGLFFGFACWSRSETILFVLPGATLLAFVGGTVGCRGIPGRLAILLSAPILLFLLWHVVYFRFVFAEVPRLGSFASAAGGKDLGETIRGILGLLGAHDLYGTIIYLFGGIFLLDIFVFRDFDATWLLAWIVLLLIGFIVVVQVFPAAFVESTAKRGFFKLFPIMIAYMGETRLLASISERLRVFERGGRSAVRIPIDPDR